MTQALLSLVAGPAPQASAGVGGVVLEAGRLHEALSAPGADGAAHGFLLAAAAALAPELLVWVRDAGLDAGAPYAPGLAQYGLQLERLLVVQARRRAEALWAAEEGLKQAGAVVLLELGARGRPIDLLVTRRLGLAAQTYGTTVLALRGDAGAAPPPSAAWTRWRVRSAPSHSAYADEVGAPAFEAELVRHRGGARGRFFLEWSNGAFRAEALGGDLAAPAFDRSVGAARRAG